VGSAEAIGDCFRERSRVVLTGMMKGFRTVFPNADYARVRRVGDEYRSRKPRSVAT
jgi:hypothetical protein